MIYTSTRGSDAITASQAILKGLSDDGGLFMPNKIPALSIPLSRLPEFSYQETAYLVMKDYLDDYTEEELKNCIAKAYDEKFDTKEIAPLTEAGDQYFLELFHGPTIAFKDMALSLLPHLLTTAMKKNHVNKEIVILTATSGDTGKAALAGFSDVEGTRILVFYPKGGVSSIQERQMVTTKGANTKVVAVHGNFDDCQTGVKKIFNNDTFKAELDEKGFCFSSANSINVGRLIPQVAYYVYAYGQMVRNGAITAGDRLDFTVPTGNFGNILAAYFAKSMGLPIGRLICASNDNKVLFDFFKTGVYDRNRDFVLTTSPSMDILISSNLERLIYLSAGSDADTNAKLMKQLAETGRYEINDSMRENIRDFYGAYATQDQVLKTIADLYEKYGYVIDPHTAVAAYADRQFKEQERTGNKSVIISTASPYKFGGTVLHAIDPDFRCTDDFEMAKRLEMLSKRSIPKAVSDIRNAPILHKEECDISDMQKSVATFLF
ncbi:MAG: threonine synthase [Lachnospiraceae bacterium]|nr:threonine synthase [Lachnospiraceae bacterium]